MYHVAFPCPFYTVDSCGVIFHLLSSGCAQSNSIAEYLFLARCPRVLFIHIALQSECFLPFNFYTSHVAGNESPDPVFFFVVVFNVSHPQRSTDLTFELKGLVFDYIEILAAFQICNNCL